MEKIKILTKGVSIYDLAEDLKIGNANQSVFDEIIMPGDEEVGFTVSAEVATIIVSAITNIVLLINIILSHLEKKKTPFTFKMVSSSGESYEFVSEMPEKTKREFIELVKSKAIKEIDIKQKARKV